MTTEPPDTKSTEDPLPLRPSSNDVAVDSSSELDCQCQLCVARVFVALSKNCAFPSYGYPPSDKRLESIYPLANPSTFRVAHGFVDSSHRLNNVCKNNDINVSLHNGSLSPSKGSSAEVANSDDSVSTTTAFNKTFSNHLVDGILSQPLSLLSSSSSNNFYNLNFNSSLASMEYPISYWSMQQGLMHIRVSWYLALEISPCGYRIVNYRNNSAISISDDADYGSFYQYTCRGLFNIPQFKVSMNFNKDRHVILRPDKVSIIGMEEEYYRLTRSGLYPTHPNDMPRFNGFNRDRTSDILTKGSGSNASNCSAKLQQILLASSYTRDASGNTVYDLGGLIKVELCANGDMHLSSISSSWTLFLSPLSGAFSLNTDQVKINSTPKSELEIYFGGLILGISCLFSPSSMFVSNGLHSQFLASSRHDPNNHPLTGSYASFPYEDEPPAWFLRQNSHSFSSTPEISANSSTYTDNSTEVHSNITKVISSTTTQDSDENDDECLAELQLRDQIVITSNCSTDQSSSSHLP